MTVKELKAMNVGEKVVSVDLFLEGANELKKTAAGKQYQVVTFKDDTGDKIRTTVFGITTAADWRKVESGTPVIVKNFVIGQYAPAGKTPMKQIDDAKIEVKQGVATPVNKTSPIASGEIKSKIVTETVSTQVSEREKHEYYKNKDEIMMREVALKTASEFWASPNLVAVFGPDTIKQGLLDPLVVITTAMFYYAWLKGEDHPEVNERLSELLKLEGVLSQEGKVAISADQLIVRFLQPTDILKTVRETLMALIPEKEKEKNAKKDSPTK